MRTKSEALMSAIEEFIGNYIDSCGVSPTVQEIGDALSVSKATVSRYVAHMRERGTLGALGNTHRGILPAETRGTVRVPVLGAVSCGIPKLAEENIEDYVRLPVSLFGTGDFFLLRAKGDSMIGAGIDDGDLVLVRKQSYAAPGQIVVALMEEEATLKRYFPEPEHRRVRLHPENPALSDIYAEDCLLQGVAVKVLKELL